MSAEGANGRRGVVVKTDLGYFCLDPEDQVVSRQLAEHGTYGMYEIELARSRMDAGSRVLVVGAHIGTAAIPLSRSCRELVAIEANPATCELLRRNVLLNDRRNITVIHAAANDRDGSLDFVMNTHNSGGAKRMPKFRDTIYFYDNPQIATVPAKRLDEILEGSFDLVFMDIEGSEYFAFLGMQRILAQARTLIVEFLPHHLTRVAGITVDDFVAPLTPHFDELTVPTTGRMAGPEAFASVLRDMHARDHADPAIVFRKHG